MSSHHQDRVRSAVRDAYGRVAEGPEGDRGLGCCSPVAIDSTRLGYSAGELAGVPTGADLGLGCGNPQALARLRAGETVLDLGAGAGFDCLLAARQVGESGQVIGVDMTPEMVTKARSNARQAGFGNLEFRLGEIEALPIADASIDVIISNCVINLSPDKARVFREAFRVLKPGGRLAISDVVARMPLPPEIRDDPQLYCGCVSGAAEVAQLERLLAEAGFSAIRIEPKAESREFIREWAPASRAEDYVCSATITAVKPAAG